MAKDLGDAVGAALGGASVVRPARAATLPASVARWGRCGQSVCCGQGSALMSSADDPAFRAKHGG